MTESGDCLAVDLHDVAKTYRGRVHALRGIEMQVAQGEIHGLLGPNGAGKTTLMKIMMTVVRPSLARGNVLGKPIGHRATLGRIGYLPENHRQPQYLTARQALDYYGALSKVDRPTRRRRAETLLQLVGMTDWADKKIGTFSKGMQQRIGLAQALINSPDLVLLDEPTDGLDPVGRREIREVLKHLRGEGKTVFLNSHLLSEVELVCDRVAILTAGQVVRQGTIDELTADSLHYEILVSADSTDDLGGKIREALGCKLAPAASPSIAWTTGSARPSEPIQSGLLPSGETVEVAGGCLRVLTPHAAAVQPLIDSLRQRGLIIESVRPIRQSLEDFFIGFVEQASNGPVTAELVEQGGRS